MYNVSFFLPYPNSYLKKSERVFETVIGDTLVNGKRFGKVFSSFDNSIRFERSTDTAVYVWTSQNGEQLQYSWNFDSTKSVQWNQWTIFPKTIFVANVRTWLNTSISSAVYNENAVLFNYYSNSNYSGNNTVRMAVRYRKLVGLDSVFSNGDFSTIRGNYTNEAKLIGYIIDGKAKGDIAASATFQMTIGVSKLEARNNDTVCVPIFTTGINTRYLIDSTPLPASLSYNASMLEPIAGTQAGSVQNGIRTVPFTFALTPGADTARATLLFRAAVGNDTITTLIPRIEPQSGINYRTTAVNGSVRVFGNQAGGEQQRFFSKAARVRLVAVSPNPASDQLTISLVASEKTPMTISIVNVLGERLLRNEIMLESGIHDVPMSVSGLPRGVYLLTLQTETDIITRQIHILP